MSGEGFREVADVPQTDLSIAGLQQEQNETESDDVYQHSECSYLLTMLNPAVAM